VNRTSGAGTRRPVCESNGVGSGRREVDGRSAETRPVEEPRAPLPTHVRETEPLPPRALEDLNAGVAALGLADLPEASLARIEGHLRLLLAWNRAINLTAIRDPLDAVRLHVLDSLAAVPALRSRGLEAVLDLGSGGGYPGIPLAVVLPARRALLVDSVGKKAAFLRTVVAALDIGDVVDVASLRAESLAADRAHRGRWPAVVARAVAGLAELAELALPLVQVGGILVAWKREPLEAELAAAAESIALLGGGVPTVESVAVAGLASHRLVIVPKLRATPSGFPRDPAARARDRRSEAVPPWAPVRAPVAGLS